MSNSNKIGFLYKLYEFIEYNEENNINCINWYKDEKRKGFKIIDKQELIDKLNENNITKGKLGSFYRQLNYYNIFTNKNKNEFYYHKNNLFYKGNYEKLNLIKRDNLKKKINICINCKRKNNNLPEKNNIKKIKKIKENKKIKKIKKYISIDILKITENFLNMELKRLKKQKVIEDMEYLNFFNFKKYINKIFDDNMFDIEIDNKII